MVPYLLIVFGLGGAWFWVLVIMRGPLGTAGLVVVLIATVAVAVAQRRRSKRLSSPWEWIPSRAITHVGTGSGSRWNRGRSQKPDDPDDFEAHVGGGF